MAQRIRYLYMGRIRDSWYQMSQEEQDELTAKVSDSFDQSGGKRLGISDCSWSSSQWEWFGMEEYPSIDALQKHIERQREMGFLTHIKGARLVGTPWESEED